MPFVEDIDDMFYKSSPNICHLFGRFEKCNFLNKIAFITFWLLLRNFELLFVPTFGHTSVLLRSSRGSVV